MTRTEMVSAGLMTVKEASKFLGLGRTTLYQLMDSGHLSYVKIGGARRIPRRALEHLAAQHLVGVREGEAC